MVHAAWRTRDHPVEGAPLLELRPGRLALLLQHNVTVPHRRAPGLSPSEEPEYASAQAYCTRSALPFYCEHEFAWAAERVNVSHIRVRLGALPPLVVGGVRGCDATASG